MYIDWFDLSYVPISRDANIVINCFMENREQQILSEIKVMMASVRSQLERLDAKMAELQQIVDPEEFEAESIDIELDLDEVVEAVQTVEVQEIPLQMEDDDDLPFAESEAVEEPVEDPVEEYVDQIADEPEEEAAEEIVEELSDEPSYESEEDPGEEPEEESADEVVEVPVEESYEEPEQVEEPVEQVADEPAEEDDDDLPGVFDIPEPVTVASKAAEQAKPVLNDVIMADYAWRRDMPGSSVKDIRSAIGLNDRVRFINNLFKEDAQAFVNALTEINKMESIDEVVGYVCAQYPEWEMGSELVYRFMMAVRRKIR